MKKGQKLFEIDENKEFPVKRAVPLLKLCESPRAADSPTEITSLTYRMKKRNQVHRSLDFNLSSSQLFTPRVIKADHSLHEVSTPKSLTNRKPGFGSTITVNNRRVARNLLLDSFPM